MRYVLTLLFCAVFCTTAKAQSLEETLGYLLFLKDDTAFVDHRYTLVPAPNVRIDATIVDNCNVRLDISQSGSSERAEVKVDFSKASKVDDKHYWIVGQALSCSTEFSGDKAVTQSCSDTYEAFSRMDPFAPALQRFQKAYEYYRTTYCKGRAF